MGTYIHIYNQLRLEASLGNTSHGRDNFVTMNQKRGKTSIKRVDCIRIEKNYHRNNLSLSGLCSYKEKAKKKSQSTNAQP